MIKALEVAHDDSTWNKALPDEPLFILRANDTLAPQVVDFWIHLAASYDSPPAKVQSAMQLRDRMRSWQAEHPDLVKVPD